VQAARWSPTADGGGYIYSSRAALAVRRYHPHRCARLAVGHLLGHALMGEGDREISLLDRLIEHARATARYSVYYGEGRDAYDVRGRVAHESIFNTNGRPLRCPNSQQGYSPSAPGRAASVGHVRFRRATGVSGHAARPAFGSEMFEKAARATCDFYLENTRPMAFLIGTRARPASRRWATGAPKRRTRSIRTKPVDSSAGRDLPLRGCCAWATVSGTSGTGKPDWRSATRFSTSPI